MRARLRKIKAMVFGVLIWILYKSIQSTWRIQLIEPEEFRRRLANREPFVLAHWHGDELALIHLNRRYRIATLVSLSQDGEMMNTVLYLLGCTTVRGSSSRGSVSGLRALMKLVQHGHVLSFAVDGPRGPRHEVKPGVLEVARTFQLPVFAGRVQCESKWTAERAWNLAYLPKPFAKVIIEWVPVFHKLTKDQDPRSPELLQTLKQALVSKGEACYPEAEMEPS